MENKTYSDMRLEKFLHLSAHSSNAYQVKRWVKLATLPIVPNEAVNIPASFSFVIERKETFASLQIKRKIINPRLMLVKLLLIEVIPQLNQRSFSSFDRGVK